VHPPRAGEEGGTAALLQSVKPLWDKVPPGKRNQHGEKRPRKVIEFCESSGFVGPPHTTRPWRRWAGSGAQGLGLERERGEKRNAKRQNKQ
jgi:hypothetical protein